MRIHREGYPTLIFALTLLGAIDIIAVILAGPAALWVTIPVSLVVFGFFARFFRDPPRTTPDADGSVFAPADGTVVAIEPMTESEYFGDDRLKVSIYMSALNVHVNRVPFTGAVRYVKYHPGKYLVAFHPKASELNERATIVIGDAQGRTVLVRQIAGLLARRIVTYAREDQAMKAGEELGFIKFGSRCDVFLPPGADVQVSLNQRVTGGETLLARL